jgi:hypothetical protein
MLFARCGNACLNYFSKSKQSGRNRNPLTKGRPCAVIVRSTVRFGSSVDRYAHHQRTKHKNHENIGICHG